MIPRAFWLPVIFFGVAVVVLLLKGEGSPHAPSVTGSRPDTLTVETIGTSVKGRDIEAVSLGVGPSTVLVIGGLHAGPENPSADLAEQLARYIGEHVRELPPAVRLVVIPRANPDGYANDSRANANGVDLNRNWPADNWQPNAVHGDTIVSGGNAPLSEPETSALYAYIDALSPDIVISLHGYGAVVEPNNTGHAQELAARYAKAAGYRLIENWSYYEITGELIEAMNDLQTAAFDVELRDGEKQRFARSLSGLKAVLKGVAEAADQAGLTRPGD